MKQFVKQKMMLEFRFKHKDYELRACPKHLARFEKSDPNETIDFVKWKTRDDGTKYCFSIAYWCRGPEGYSLNFVGNRFVDNVAEEDVPILWQAITMAQKTLDSWFNMTKGDESK